MNIATHTTPHADTAAIPSLSLPSALLRLEGALIFLAVVAAFVHHGWSGWLFVALLFVPDVGMVGYLVNATVGARFYNLVHTYTVPLIVIAVALAAESTLGLQIGLMWLAHCGFDRVWGYGLKYATAFKDTHMQRV